MPGHQIARGLAPSGRAIELVRVGRKGQFVASDRLRRPPTENKNAESSKTKSDKIHRDDIVQNLFVLARERDDTRQRSLQEDGEHRPRRSRTLCAVGRPCVVRTSWRRRRRDNIRKCRRRSRAAHHAECEPRIDLRLSRSRGSDRSGRTCQRACPPSRSGSGFRCGPFRRPGPAPGRTAPRRAGCPASGARTSPRSRRTATSRRGCR